MSPPIEIGLNVVPVPPADLLEAAVLAEDLGYGSLWIGEHVVVPWEYDSPNPYTAKAPFEPGYRFLEPFAALTAIGAVTERVRLGTGVAILPLRDPFVTARSIATADVLSGGRIEVGVGMGWLKEEFAIVGRDWSTRASRADEMIELITELFVAERPEHHGREWDVPPVGFEPKPIQSPRPPILVAGTTEPALRRAARLGDGWIGPHHEPDDVAGIVRRLHAHDRGDRPPLTITLQGRVEGDPEAYAAAGVDRLIVTPWERPSRWRQGIEAAARRFGLTGPR